MDFLWWFIAAFIVFDVLIVVWIFAKQRKQKLDPAELAYYRKQWQSIKTDADKRHAVMDADKLLATLLRKRGYEGPLGEKLKQAKGVFSDYNGVWRAHKLRNRLAHELNVELKPEEAHQALRNFERAFRDLGLL